VEATELKNDPDRRTEPRTSHPAIVIMAYGEGQQLEFENAQLIDCSPHGISILFHRPIQPGQDFLLKLKLDRVTLVNYAVRSCVPSGRLFRIGGEFTRYVGAAEDLPPEAAYNALLAS
jgi:hypothetical protein